MMNCRAIGLSNGLHLTCNPYRVYYEQTSSGGTTLRRLDEPNQSIPYPSSAVGTIQPFARALKCPSLLFYPWELPSDQVARLDDLGPISTG
jgi:hypothetical protein